MTLIYQKFIKRVDLQSNRSAIYVFGDNYDRVGLGGQAAEMRGEPNALGIVNKRRPDYNDGCFLTDKDYEKWLQVHEPIFKLMMNFNGTIIWPADGIGTGLAELDKHAPKIFNQIQLFLSQLEKKHAGF